MKQLTLWDRTHETLDAHFPLAPKAPRPLAQARKSDAHVEAAVYLDDFERYERRERVDPQTGYVEECR